MPFYMVVLVLFFCASCCGTSVSACWLKKTDAGPACPSALNSKNRKTRIPSNTHDLSTVLRGEEIVATLTLTITIIGMIMGNSLG